MDFGGFEESEGKWYFRFEFNIMVIFCMFFLEVSQFAIDSDGNNILLIDDNGNGDGSGG